MLPSWVSVPMILDCGKWVRIDLMMGKVAVEPIAVMSIFKKLYEIALAV
jgi:hypothetical protein